MALFQFRRQPAKQPVTDKAAQERIKILSAALVAQRAVAQRLKRWLAVTTAALVVMTGLFVFVNREQVTQVVGNYIPGMGDKPMIEDIDAAYAAYSARDDKRALRIARPLAEQGYARAQALLGALYERGHALPRDDQEALQWFHRAADQRDSLAQLYLGSMYAEGRGVPQSYSEAAKWYRLAADQGDAQAMYNLGVLYAQGQGMPVNNVMAHMWFNLAASNYPASEPRNRDAAAQNRDFIAKKMTGDEIAEAQQKAREWSKQRTKGQNGS